MEAFNQLPSTDWLSLSVSKEPDRKESSSNLWWLLWAINLEWINSLFPGNWPLTVLKWRILITSEQPHKLKSLYFNSKIRTNYGQKKKNSRALPHYSNAIECQSSSTIQKCWKRLVFSINGCPGKAICEDFSSLVDTNGW